MEKGRVYLVGAGPGDPKLITVKGLEALQRSDAVVYDRLAGAALLMKAKPGAELIYVGKRPDRHTMKQEEINQLLVDLALQGKTVTRLKGGDPSVFGRVGEEAELLVQHGIEYDIVPGITSAVAVPAYAGIPVTHRDFNSSFLVVTGHEQPEKLDTTIHWDKVANAADTLIFLMGVAKIRYISEQLIQHGRSPATPIALVRWGTRPEQETLTGTLATIADQVEQADFKPPAVIVVGEVVRLRDKLKWMEKKPLFGKRILVTRARAQASELVDRIAELGGEPIEFPVIQIREPADPAASSRLDNAIRQADGFDWLMFTSANGVSHFFDRMVQVGEDVRKLHRVRIAAVGPKTAEALRNRGIVATSLPEQYQAEGLFESLLPELQAGQRVLLPRSAIARAWLPKELVRLGLEVVEVDVYETVTSADGAEVVIDLLLKGSVDYITFTSSSTVTNLWNVISAYHAHPLELLSKAKAVCIGPVTAQTAAGKGIPVHCVAPEATVESMLATMIEDRVN
ncbi:hypothetical protein XYCOK13_30210 [Xylanibacillus composti]|uniref:Uroporphyrinogen-III C-methyltransferase n=1 Tax=Xylanibacillus composti TaxID=1572762 RepID=A0A8J4H603_9BACL|nr:uroporphyrinogen-III C-methyltransferase [Xylanibacillus composti]GIQ70197.1 hypothetical protein XYCOK13_30210 [Xylanibacillus composti]